MNTPILDNRTKAQVMEQIARLAAEYVPEWTFSDSTEDPGAALAKLFGEMFFQTVDRFNAVPQKLYTEFLNLLGVDAPPVTPAAGLVQFQVHEGVDDTVPIPARSMLYAEDENGDQIVYETRNAIEATPAQLEAVYYVDARGGTIQEADLSREQPFFAPLDGPNLQGHRFQISQNEVLNLQGECQVTVRLKMGATFLAEGLVQRLSDPGFATWSWLGENGLVPFDAVRCEQDRLILTKTTAGALRPDENGHLCLYCDMQPGDDSITINGVQVESGPLKDLQADSLAFNDIPIQQGDGGYCFGRMPAPYELFYIRSDPVFSKRGAEVRMNLDIRTITYTEVDSSPQYQFGQRLIDKNEAVSIKPDDVFVREVAWEYYNGRGWARLQVLGNQNPFSGKEEGRLETRFTVPEDMEPVLVNAEEGLYIRARVVYVENSLSTVPRWILPFVKNVTCSWQYVGGRPISWACSANNASRQVLEEIAGVTDLRFEIYSNLEEQNRSMYFCFDRPVRGTPVSMMFDVVGKSDPRGKLLYSFWNGSQFESVRAMDGTHNLANSGPVYLYLTREPKRKRFFDREGYWLRMSLSQTDREKRRPPVISAIRFNVAPAVQQQRAYDQYFSAGFYDTGKVIQLLETPVLECEIWVDEAGSISDAEIADLTRNHPEDVQITRDGNTVTSCRVRWKRVQYLAQGGPDDRVFVLDSHTGRVRFGDGRNGKVPPVGFENILVRSTYGGGVRGNLPTGALTQFLVSVPRISGLENITPMGGGTDRMTTPRLERLGNRRLRHRGRAVGVRDYEELVLENFTRVAHVKCFSGVDETGQPRSGHLCIVIMGSDMDDERMLRELCEEIYEFLAQRSDCTMVAGGRLHVRASTEMTINTSIQVVLKDLDLAAQTQQEILQALAELIDGRWRTREIGRQLRTDEIYSVVKAVPNIKVIRSVVVEGTWYEDGKLRVSPIEQDGDFPFATVRNGNHLVQIE